LLAGEVAPAAAMIARGIPRSAERDRDQEPPQVVPVGQVELAAHPTRAEAVEHALEHVLLAKPWAVDCRHSTLLITVAAVERTRPP
jgi:hypothetical protein